MKREKFIEKLKTEFPDLTIKTVETLTFGIPTTEIVIKQNSLCLYRFTALNHISRDTVKEVIDWINSSKAIYEKLIELGFEESDSGLQMDYCGYQITARIGKYTIDFNNYSIWVMNIDDLTEKLELIETEFQNYLLKLDQLIKINEEENTDFDLYYPHDFKSKSLKASIGFRRDFFVLKTEPFTTCINYGGWERFRTLVRMLKSDARDRITSLMVDSHVI